jgi:uncharacterized protein YpmB
MASLEPTVGSSCNTFENTNEVNKKSERKRKNLIRLGVEQEKPVFQVLSIRLALKIIRFFKMQDTEECIIKT